MSELIDGAIKFMQEDYQEYKEVFKELKSYQNPHTLFIGCSDSRVLPNLITNCSVGELFSVRNVANIIPKYRITEEYVSTTSAIEYALEVLDVKNVIICGHTNCGGCKVDIDKQKTPNTYKWLEQIKPIKDKILQTLELNHMLDLKLASWMIEKANLINSYENLLTYPNVKQKLQNKELEIHVWHYVIETGKIYEYVNGHFKRIGKNKTIKGHK